MRPNQSPNQSLESNEPTKSPTKSHNPMTLGQFSRRNDHQRKIVLTALPPNRLWDRLRHLMVDFNSGKSLKSDDCNRDKSDCDSPETGETSFQEEGREARTIPLFRQPNEYSKVSSSNSLSSDTSESDESSETMEENSSDHYCTFDHIEQLTRQLSTCVPADQSSDSKESSETQPKYNSRVLGHDEHEFCTTRLTALVRQYIPDHVVLAHPSPGHHRRMRSRTVNEPWHFNCGMCASVKLFAVATLMVTIATYLWDECFKPNSLVELFGERMPSTNHSIPVPHNRSKVVGKHAKVNILPSPNSRQYCGFKAFYIALMVATILQCIFIGVVYTCGLVVKCHEFGWFLFEAILCCVLATSLLLCSLVAYFVANRPFSTSLDASLILLIGLWVYRKRHTSDPLYLCRLPSGNVTEEINKILAWRQFSRLFEMEKNKNLRSVKINHAIIKCETTSMK